MNGDCASPLPVPIAIGYYGWFTPLADLAVYSIKSSIWIEVTGNAVADTSTPIEQEFRRGR